MEDGPQTDLVNFLVIAALVLFLINPQVMDAIARTWNRRRLIWREFVAEWRREP